MLSGQNFIPESEKIVRILSLYATSFGSSCHGGLSSIRWVAERHMDLLKVQRIVAWLIAASKCSIRENILLDPTAVQIMQARHLLEIIYG